MKTLLSAIASTFRQFEILLMRRKDSALGAIIGYLVGLSWLGPSASLNRKLAHLSLSASAMFSLFMVYSAWVIFRQSRIFNKRFDLEEHYCQVARRQGDLDKAKVHLDLLKAYLKDLYSGEYLKWK